MPPRRSTKVEAVAESPGGTSNYHTQALNRGLLVMELLAREVSPLTLTDLHAGTELPKPTLVRLLTALVELQYVVRVDERPAFRLGHKVLALGRAYAKGLDISQAAGGYLDELAAQTRQTSNLGVLDGTRVLHVCVRVPDRPLRFETAVGARAHTYCTGLGKLLLSRLAPEEVAAHVEPFEAFTEHTIGDLAALERDLAKTRRRGYAFDDNEHSEGLRCLAVPVEVAGTTIAAVSVSGPAAEFGPTNQRRYLELLHETAAALVADQEVVDAFATISTGHT
jgi:DNA-binding IclR family transcriptional regulator